MKKCRICESEIPNWAIINGKRRCLSSRKFCLTCSPFGVHNTTNLKNKLVPVEDRERKCPRCQEIKNLKEFYKRRSESGGPSTYCKICTNNQTLERQRLFKQLCVAYKGGRCENCGYAKSIVALDFHHLNSDQKDFAISKTRLWRFDERVKEELDKCQMLCRNCHAEEHARLNEIKYGVLGGT